MLCIRKSKRKNGKVSMVSIEYCELVRLEEVVVRKKLVEIYYHHANRNISGYLFAVRLG